MINQYKAYKFDKIVIKISVTPVLRHTNDHNLIFLTVKICFAYLNHSHTDKTS